MKYVDCFTCMGCKHQNRNCYQELDIQSMPILSKMKGSDGDFIARCTSFERDKIPDDVSKERYPVLENIYLTFLGGNL